MELTLERKFLNTTSTEGNLLIDGKWFCHTIEDVVRAKPGQWKSQNKVYAKTAIPYGVYPVLVTWSNRFKRMLTGVFGVPDFEGIRIHNGSSENSSAGCIIVSFKADDGNGSKNRLINDPAAMNQLCEIITKAQLTQKITLTIIEKP